MITEEVRLWKLTRRHVRERLEQGLIKGAILPTGSTDQHNEHLTMEHDTAGTLSLRPETFLTVAYDICESLKRHGIEHIMICNGHAGNGPLGNQVEEFSQKLGIDIQFASYWAAYSKELVDELMESKDCPAHAAEFETSFAMAAFPENVQWKGVDYEAANLDIKSESYAPRDPVYFQAGRDYATPKKGRVMADIAIDWVASRMQEMMDG